MASDTATRTAEPRAAPAAPPSHPPTRLQRVLARAERFAARISIRLLAFNVLLVFLPAAGLLYLDTYEEQMLRAQESAMVQQGRLLAAALSSPDGIDSWEAERILLELKRRQQARLRVVDRAGKLVADSSRLGPERESAVTEEPVAARRGWLYELGALPFRLYRRLARPVRSELDSRDYYSGAERLLGPEIQAALAGRYGAATRISGGQRSVTLYAAIPIRYGRRITGVALVSQSTYAILQALYAVRRDIFLVVLASVAVAAVLSLLVSTTIARPLRRLSAEARAITDGRGRLRRGFRGSERRDEIGDLSRALEELTNRLRGHLSFVEALASDVSHELKNPLASIRSATELLAEVEDPAQRRRFLSLVEREVARMGRLLSAVREASRIDARLEDEERSTVDLRALVDGVLEGYRVRTAGDVAFELRCEEASLPVHAAPDRLTQVLENLLDNAVSFSPAGGTIRVALDRQEGTIRATISDDGPGVAPEHAEKIFQRFFSYRPGRDQNGHVGLGLPIAKAILEGHRGTIRVLAQPNGAAFEVRLPEAPAGVAGKEV
jgi:two-component system, OmpR family, sensor histidine kinase ChvG